MKLSTILAYLRRGKEEVPALGTRELLCDWVRDGEDPAAPMVEMRRYGELLSVLPDKIVESLERARLAHDGRIPMLKAGLGYEELLNTIVVDGAAIASSSAEARLSPALLIPANYMQPGGIPGRHLRFILRGRVTTLATSATMTFRNRIATTDVITGTTLQATGAIAADATGQTNTMWNWKSDIVVRSVGTAGTVFAMGDAEMATAAATVAAQTARFSGSAGSATPATATWDMTVPQFFQVTGQWSLATAYSIQAHQYALEALN